MSSGSQALGHQIVQSSKSSNKRNLFIEVIGLQTPRGRILFFLAASLVIFFLPFEWLKSLSIWQRLGVPSPSIGLTRAYWLLIHGDPVAAWQRNKLIYVVIAVGAVVLAVDTVRLLRRKKLM